VLASPLTVREITHGKSPPDALTGAHRAAILATSRCGETSSTRIRIVHYEDLLTQSTPASGTHILAALDQVAGASAELLAQLHRSLAHHPEFRFVNHPVGTLQRYELLAALHRVLFHGRHWMLKQSAADFNMNWSLEELAYVVENPHRDQLSRIRELAGVEYGRIDYSIRQGRVQPWEINLKPTIGRGRLRLPSGRVPPELVPMRRQVKEVFYRGFQAALEALDTAAPEPVGRPVRGHTAPGRLSPIGVPARIRLPRLRQWLRPVWSHLVLLQRLARHVRDRVAIALLAPVGRRRVRKS